MIRFLSNEPAESLDRYVLLDAQDWMDDAALKALWSEITRTAAPGARVIFRTAARKAFCPAASPTPTLAHWTYDAAKSAEIHAKDRSSIYGGFHLYVKTAERRDAVTSARPSAMDRMYRHQRYIYDLTRRYYLFGRDQLIAELKPPPGGSC